MQKSSLFGLVALLAVIIGGAVIAQQYGLIPDFREGGLSGSGASVVVLGTVNASTVQFTVWEENTWLGIKDRLAINNTDPDFTGIRLLQWISMRNSSSGDYYQKSMEWLAFWEGQGANGEWQASVCLYNVPNVTDEFVVEVSRNTWNSLDVLLDGSVIASFPEVNEDNVESIGYVTFHVNPL